MIYVIGAGPAGLIAAGEILRAFPKQEATLIDKAAIPPEGESPHPFFIHGELSGLGVSIEKVKVQEIILGVLSEAANHYALRTIGVLSRNRIWDLDKAVTEREWGLAKNLQRDLFESIPSRRLRVVRGSVSMITKHGVHVSTYGDTRVEVLPVYHEKGDWIVNTIPIPVIARALQLDAPKVECRNVRMGVWDLSHDPGFNNVCQVYYNCGAGAGKWSRFSNTNGRMIVEMDSDEYWGAEVPVCPADQLPYPYNNIPDQLMKESVAPLRFVPGNKREIDSWIVSQTRDFRMLSFGRFATWRYTRVDHLQRDCESLIKIIRKEK